jgi:hypothetical protein
MDCKDRVYTKRTKEMKLRIKEIIRKRSNILVKKEVDLDMIVDYFSYACIFGEDVAMDADKPEVSNWKFNYLIMDSLLYLIDLFKSSYISI